jgi:hypothetical protein
MKLYHRFWIGNTTAQGFWAHYVFKDVDSLASLERKLELLAFPANPADLNGHDPYEKILGDGWEAFNEFFIRSLGMHRDIGIVDLRVCPPGTIGVDFTGKGLNLNPATVQSKYKGKSKAWDLELVEGQKMKLERFQNQSLNKFGVEVSDTHNMIVMTNAKDINYWTSDKLLFGKVRCIGRAKIEFLVNDNPAFWQSCRDSITYTNPNIVF